MNKIKRKRILIFNDSLILAGTEKLLISLLVHLTHIGCDITLVLPYQSAQNVLLPEVPQEVKIKYLYSENEPPFKRKKEEIRMIFNTKKFLQEKELREEDYDLVICFKEGFHAKMFCEWKIFKVLWLHNILYEREYTVNSLKERFSVWLNKKELAKVQAAYGLYDRVICVSEACKQSYIRVACDGRMPIQDLRILPNGINREEIIRLSMKPINLDIDRDRINFISLTRNSPDKGIVRIITAAQKLKSEGFNFSIYLLGHDTDNEKIKLQIEALLLQDTIILLGLIPNPYPYVKQCDWLICSSERESFSLALVEAMTLGVPVITTDCGGPRSIVDHGKYGLLVENSEEGIYLGLKSVLEKKIVPEDYTANLDKCTGKYNIESWLQTANKLLNL